MRLILGIRKGQSVQLVPVRLVTIIIGLLILFAVDDCSSEEEDMDILASIAVSAADLSTTNQILQNSQHSVH